VVGSRRLSLIHPGLHSFSFLTFPLLAGNKRVLLAWHGDEQSDKGGWGALGGWFSPLCAHNSIYVGASSLAVKGSDTVFYLKVKMHIRLLRSSVA
jgi:hypothetical protein